MSQGASCPEQRGFTGERKRLSGLRAADPTEGPGRRSVTTGCPAGAVASARAHPNSVASESARGSRQQEQNGRRREGAERGKHSPGARIEDRGWRPQTRSTGARTGELVAPRETAGEGTEMPSEKRTSGNEGHTGVPRVTRWETRTRARSSRSRLGDTGRQGWGKHSPGILGEDEVPPSSSWLGEALGDTKGPGATRAAQGSAGRKERAPTPTAVDAQRLAAFPAKSCVTAVAVGTATERGPFLARRQS